MRYKVLTLIIVVLAVFIFRFGFMKEKITNYEIVYEQITTIDHKVYFYDEDSLVYVNVKFENDVTIEKLFNILTINSNSIKETYDTKLNLSSKLLNFSVEKNNIFLNINEDFLRFEDEDSIKILNQLQNTFSNLGYDFLYLKINDIKLDYIGFINVESGIKLSNI